MTPPLPVAAPEPRGLRYGLLTAAIGPLDLPMHARAGGITYEPVSCGRARSYDLECHSKVSKVFDPATPLQTLDAFVVYASVECGSVGTTPGELEAKVRRRLANGEQTQAESAMAALLTAGATPLVAPGLGLADTVAELEQWLYGTTLYGNVGVLHTSARLAAYAQSEELLVRDGPLWRTAMGTVWSFGGGYPDHGEIYISGSATVWRAADVVVPAPASMLSTSTNEYRLVAEREYVVSYDCVAAEAVFDWGVTT